MSKQNKSQRRKRYCLLKEAGTYELKIINASDQRTQKGKPIDGFSFRAEVQFGDQKGKIVDLTIFNCNEKDSDQVCQIKERLKFFSLRALRAEAAWMVCQGKGKFIKATLKKYKNFLTIQNYKIEPVFEQGEKEVNVCDFNENIINPRSKRFKGWDFEKQAELAEVMDLEYPEFKGGASMDYKIRTQDVDEFAEFDFVLPRRPSGSEYTSKSMDEKQYAEFARRRCGE